MKKLILPVMAMFAAAGAYAEEAKIADMEPLKIVKTDNGMSELKHFPQAASGQVRHVIAVEPKSDEGQYKIELVVGKKQMVDCNRQWFGGTLTQKTVEGFGYDYYETGDLAGPMSTMMGCLNNEKHEAFVSANLGDEAFVRYNSRLPVVVYAPKDVEVKYRIWSTDNQLLDAPAK
ncbi:serine protease inhibitor ecotin [Morganella morganii]|uniref:serine protease inhibitor ecotin n=1 Tax=Morganella morganii TaxID=582 RepID=UPI0034E40DCA